MAALYYMALYADYNRCRALRIPINATELDAPTLSILSTIHRKITELRDAKRKIKHGS